ncbi:MAG: hypothetical protein ABWY45_02600 [Mycobacterium sp.]
MDRAAGAGTPMNLIQLSIGASAAGARSDDAIICVERGNFSVFWSPGWGEWALTSLRDDDGPGQQWREVNSSRSYRVHRDLRR